MKISNRFYDVFAKNRLQQLTICIYKIEKWYQIVRLMVFTAYNLKLAKIEIDFYILQNVMRQDGFSKQKMQKFIINYYNCRFHSLLLTF